MRLPRSRRALELAIRATGVLAVLVIALVTGTLVEAWQQIVLVVILAVTATLPQSPAWLRYVTVLAEAGVIGAIVVSAPAGVRPSVAYLVVPPIVAALMAGVLGALAAGLTTTLVLVIGVVWRQGDNLPEPVADLMIWLAVAVALGLGTAVARHLRERIAPTQDSYAAARTLLSALREVTRRLPEGLEEPVLARTTLSAVAEILPHDHAAVYLQTRSGNLVAAIDDDRPVPWTPHWDRGLWAQVLEAGTAMQRAGGFDGAEWIADRGGDQASALIPLRLEGEPIGVIALQRHGGLWEITDIARAQQEVDAAALRLDAARMFDEIRELATTEERRRMSREIHDGIAQELVGLGFLVDDLAHDDADPHTREQVARIRDELTRIITELRLSIFDLRTESGVGIQDALASYVNAVGTQSGLAVHVVLDEDGSRLPPGVGPQLLRIAQEAIANVRRHARARTLWVTYRVDEEGIVLRIVDDGRGLLAPTETENHFGMTIMRERAESIGGDLTVRRRDGGGTVVELTAPASHPHRRHDVAGRS